ncbi:MAG: MFS transporter [Acidimicrobiia bacterium]|nr:MFS transporter [Acidimicrobiia bacterium]
MQTHAISVAGDASVAASLAGSLFFAQPTSAARSDILLYLLLTMAPFAVLSPVMGPILDRFRGGRRIMVIISCLGRAVLCLAMVQFIIQPSPEGLLIYPLAFGVLVLQKTYSIAKAALVPAIVTDSSQLVRANSRLAIVSLVASMVGGAPAFLLQVVFDARFSLAFAVMMFTVATFFAFRIPRTRVVQNATEEKLESEETHQPSVLLAGSAMAVIRVAVGVIVFLSAFTFKDDKIGLAFVLGAYAVGGFIGNTVAPVARKRVREEVILTTCLLSAGALSLLGAIAGGDIVGAALASLAVATASAAGRVGFDSLLQRDGPDAARGRAFARFETRFQLAWVAGALFGLIPFSEDFGLFALGFLLVLAGLSYLTALRSARTAPSRSKLRPQVVDQVWDLTKGRVRSRYKASRAAKRKLDEQ